MKTKKLKPSAGFVLDMIGDKAVGEASELCGAWVKVRDQHVSNFFDSGAQANFIKLAS